MRLWRLTRTGPDDARLMNPLHPDAARVRPLVTPAVQLRRVPPHSADTGALLR
jgi:hypothetical protein